SITQTVIVHPNPAPWNSTVTFACSGLPALANCSFTPAKLTPGSADASSTLTVTTTAPPDSARASAFEKWLGSGMLALLVLGMVTPYRSRGVRLILGVLLFSVVTMLLAHCGGTSAPTRTPAGMYSITVTAQSAGISHSASFQMAVN